MGPPGSTLRGHPGERKAGLRQLAVRILGGSARPRPPEELATLLLPMVMRAVRTERGPAALIRWLRQPHRCPAGGSPDGASGAEVEPKTWFAFCSTRPTRPAIRSMTRDNTRWPDSRGGFTTDARLSPGRIFRPTARLQPPTRSSLWTRRGRIAFINAPAEQLFGYGRGELFGPGRPRC